MRVRVFVILASFIIAFETPSYTANAQVEDKLHDAVLKTWFKGKCHRIAESADNTDGPYYIKGDFSNDGIEDFAVIAVDCSESAKPQMLIFNGPFESMNQTVDPIYNESLYGYLNSVFGFKKDSGSIILCVKDTDNCLVLRWNETKYEEQFDD